MSKFERLYLGEIYEIWIARQENGCQVLEYGRTLPTSTYQRMRSILERTADEGKYTSEEIYRHIGEGISEFKAHIARVYSFDDARRIVLTHGGNKPKSRAGVAAERKVALRVWAEYVEWKGKGRT